MLPGVHRIRKRSAAGVTVYWYAWRGGPQILKVTGRSDAEADRLVAAATPSACEAFKAANAKGGDSVTLYGLITRYLTAMESFDIAERTKADRRKHLDKVRSDLGTLELRALESKGARKVLTDWRKESASTPKTADERFYALSRVIDWGIDQGDVHTNPIKGVSGLYMPPDRSTLIWEPHHLETLLEHAGERFAEFVQVAVHTGLRLGDLRSLPWSAVSDEAIQIQTGKSNKRRTVVIPMTEGLKAVLAAIPHSPKSVTVLNSRRKYPWSEAGVEAALQRAKADALEAARKRGRDTSGIEHLRIHDFRGTAATHFIRAGLDDKDVATILGWKEEQVREIRRRYVSGKEIGLAIARRLRENKARARL